MIWNIIKVCFLLSSIGIWISYLIGYLDVMQVIHFQGLLIITAAATVGLFTGMNWEIKLVSSELYAWGILACAVCTLKFYYFGLWPGIKTSSCLITGSIVSIAVCIIVFDFLNPEHWEHRKIKRVK